MNTIIAPIRPDETGPQVASLQEALTILLDRGGIRTEEPPDRPRPEELQRLRQALADEHARSFFGAATRQLIRYFQIQQGLGDHLHGSVEERTAAKLNETLRELGAFEEDTFIVRGTVLNPDGSPVIRAIVKAVDAGLRSEAALGEAPTGSDGRYQIRYRREQLRPEGKQAADLIVRAFDPDGNALATSDLLCRALAKATIDLVVGNLPLRVPSEYEALVARIQPYLGDTALAGLEKEDVRYLACSAGLDRLQVATLIVANRLARETSLPDWLFYALGRQGLRLQLSALPAHSVKQLRESVERAAEANTIPRLSAEGELNELMERLRSVLLRQAFAEPPEPSRITLGALLDTSLVGRELQEEFLGRYLARQGSLEDFWRSLEEDESFAAAAREDLRFTLYLGMLTRYQLPLMQQLKGLRQGGELTSLRNLAGFDRRRWRELLERTAGADGIRLPDDIPGKTPEERISHYITFLREPIEALFPSDSLRHALARVPDARPAVQTFLANTPKLDLYWTNIDSFLSEAGEGAFAGIADDQRGGVVDEVKIMQRLLRVAPRADKVRILRSAGFTSAYGVARSSRRKFRKRFAAVAEEMKDSLDSAYMVLSAEGGDAVAGTMQLSLFGQRLEAAADQLFNTASNRADLSLQYVLSAQNYYNDTQVFAIHGPGEALEQAKKKFSAENPNLEKLFDSLSYCECKHCRSVYSPAAYLVDLLHWLEAEGEDLKGELKNAKGPIRALLARRPDLANLALTCENTNTTLPYIDLVNEILESFIFMHLKQIPNIDPNQPDGFLWSDSPVGDKVLDARDAGDAQAEELRAVPQFIIPEIYDHLATQAVYPMTLPFHRPLEVMRAYLGHLGTSRTEIMEVFQAGAQDITNERLGLSPASSDIITANGTAGTKDVWQYYGFDKEQGFGEKIIKVPEFLSRTGISIEELVALLKTRFVNPHLYDSPAQPAGQVITIEVDPKDSCDVSKMELRYLVQTDNLKRIHRFLRLWRALGWPMADVDRAIHSFGGNLDAVTLQRIESLQWLKEGLKQPVESLLAFWDKLDTWGPDSLHDRLFLGKKLVPADAESSNATSVFELASDRTKLATETSNTPELLEKHQSAVFAALQLTMTDYEAINDVETLDPHPQPPTLTLRNLSVLYRYGVLARALKLRVRDIVTLVRLVPDDSRPFGKNEPAAKIDPAATVKFVETVSKLQDSGFSVPLLNYLFRGEAEPTRHPAPTRELVKTTLKTLQDGLSAIHQETKPVEDPLGEDLRKQLNLLMPLITVPKPGPGEENKYFKKPEEIQQTVDMIDWRHPDFKKTEGEVFVGKLHYTLAKALGSSFLGSVGSDLNTALSVLFPSPPPTKEQFAAQFTANVIYLRDRFLPWLRERLTHSLVVRTLADSLQTDLPVMQSLLNDTKVLVGETGGAVIGDFLKLIKQNGEAVPLLDDKEQYTAEAKPVAKTFHLLFKACALINGFDMTATELSYIAMHSTDFGNFKLGTLPVDLNKPATELAHGWFAVWIALNEFFALCRSLPKSERTLVDYLKDKDKSFDTLVEVTGWEKKQIEELEGKGFKRDKIADLQILQRAILLLKRVGVSVTQLSAWADKNEPSHETANAIIAAVKARYDRAQWLDVAHSLNDPLREKQRAALVDFLLARMQKQTASDLLEYFLIDIEMSSCMLTSRIKQAISSVQMFVQRCLLNLELEVSPDEIDADQWKWMKNYRVWEANRKVFLYPENWIEPELRDDKTPFFQDLETELLQNELTDQTVEKALINYLYKLDEVARLDIRGFCKEEQKENGAEREIYHVFGRTWNPPYVYCYRRGIFPKHEPDAIEWTPWERVDLDIQGEHLIPVVYNRRLYLFWLLLNEKPDPKSPPIEGEEPHTRWETKLAWSEYKWEKWTPRRVTRDMIPAEKGKPNENTPRDEYRLRLVTVRDSERIDLRLLKHKWTGAEESESSGKHEFTPQGAVRIDGCDQKVKIQEASGEGNTVTIKGPELSFVEGQMYRTSLSCLRLEDLPDKEILETIVYGALPFYVLTDADGISKKGSFPFCYGDRTSTYFARPIVVSKQALLAAILDTTFIFEKPAEVAPTYQFEDWLGELIPSEQVISQPITHP